MHRAFITAADVEAYETPERAKQIRSDQNAEAMAQHAYDARVSHQGNRGELSPSQTTFPTDSTHELGPNEAAMLAGKYRKHAPARMDVAELSEGPNLPHRDDKDISTLARDTSWKSGYYHAGVDAFSSDAYMEKPSPIDRKAGSKRQRRHFTSKGEEYFVTHGAGTEKPLTSSNKHLGYWRRPTETEALRNLSERPAPTEPARWQLTVPRDMLVMLARVHDIQAQRGKLHGDGRGDMLRAIAADVAPGEDVTLELFTPTEVLGMTQGLPKRYKTGEFGQFLRDTATFAKLHK
jgi:hypothetical protein